jgi:hypothetical protein
MLYKIQLPVQECIQAEDLVVWSSISLDTLYIVQRSQGVLDLAVGAKPRERHMGS